MKKILIADDHSVVREGIKHILSESPDISVAGEAINGRELLEKLGKENYDMILLDITMEGRDGLDILKDIKRRRPKLPVLILSMLPEEEYGLRALKSGASGFLKKESAPDELPKAIRKISQGGRYLSPSLAEILISTTDTGSEKPPHKELSDREFQVMRMIASGKTLTGIARELALGVNTVRTYRSHILKKMKMKRSAELTRYAIKHHLVE